MQLARRVLRVHACGGTALLVLCTLSCTRADGPVPIRVDITGAGATFPYPLYRAWFSEYSQANNVRINYLSVGSHEGMRLLAHGDVDFGATDIPYLAPTEARTRCAAVAIPMVAGDIALAYNLPGTERAPLHFDAQALAGIYSGAITRWDDRRLRSLNPGVLLPAATIVVVHRATGSGTGYAFAAYLASSGGWVVPSNAAGAQWPVGIAAEGNESVAAEVKATQFAIGFMELAYARQNRLSIGAVRGSSSAFVLPGADASDYPIRARTWIVLDPRHVPATRGTSLVAFMRWALQNGSARARDLEYVPAAPDTVAHYDSVLRTMKFGACA